MLIITISSKYGVSKMKENLTNEAEKGTWYTVKWYNPYKGYGFVTKDPEGQSPDIFLHFSVIE